MALSCSVDGSAVMAVPAACPAPEEERQKTGTRGRKQATVDGCLLCSLAVVFKHTLVCFLPSLDAFL